MWINKNARLVLRMSMQKISTEQALSSPEYATTDIAPLNLDSSTAFWVGTRKSVNVHRDPIRVVLDRWLDGYRFRRGQLVRLLLIRH